MKHRLEWVLLVCAAFACSSSATYDDAGSDAGDAGSDVSADGPSDVSIDPGPQCAAASGWCFASPLPDGSLIHDFAINAANDVFTVGALSNGGGTVSHWNGSTWSTAATASAPLEGAWRTATNDIWVVGDHGGILRYNGTTWSPATSPTSTDLFGVWSSSATDVWVVGDHETLAHWDGLAWTTASNNAGMKLLGVWGTSPNDVWAFGADATTMKHWTASDGGAAWSDVATPLTFGRIRGAWGSTATDVWAVGEGGVIHWNGSSWSLATTPAFGYSGVWGSSATDVWVVGTGGASTIHFDGLSWKTAASQLGVSRVHGSAANDIWAAGDALFAYHFTTSWSLANAAANTRLVGLWGSTPDDLWAVGGSGELGHWNGATWAASTTTLGVSLNDVSGTSAKDVWVVGSDAQSGHVILHWDGNAWADSPSGAGSSGYLNGVFALAPNDAWAVGDAGLVLHWDGSTWSPRTGVTSASLGSVWASSPTDVWMGGYQTIIHWNGTAWSSTPPFTGSYFSGIWGTSGKNVWAAGSDGLAGVMVNWNGTSWTPSTIPAPYTPYRIAGRSANDIYATAPGMTSAILHWDGGVWSVMQPDYAQPSNNMLGVYGIWTMPSTDVWVAGDSGIILYH